MTDSGFTVDVDQNQYLPEGGRDVSAVVTVSSGADVDLAAPGGGAGSAEIVIIDCSGSMDYPPTKMSQAKVATAAAIDVVRDGVGFAVVGLPGPAAACHLAHRRQEPARDARTAGRRA